MKGSLAAMLVAAAHATRVPLAGTVVLTLVADEEFGSIGTEEALRWIASSGLRVHGAVVAEPSSLELTVAHRGFAWFELELIGRAAHGSQPELGIDAIAGATAVLPELERWSTALASAPAHRLLGTGTVRVATISGGVDAATVAPTCTMTIERRTLPGETMDGVEQQLRTVIHDSLVSLPELQHTVRRLVARPAFEADPESTIVRAVRTAAETERGASVAERGEPFWTDAALFAEAGIPCVVFGVDGGGAHADREWVSVDSVRTLTSILEATIRDFCG
jgi:succinyl-diaminopimelate desuccinylase